MALGGFFVKVDRGIDLIRGRHDGLVAVRAVPGKIRVGNLLDGGEVVNHNARPALARRGVAPIEDFLLGGIDTVLEEDSAVPLFRSDHSVPVPHSEGAETGSDQIPIGGTKDFI